MGMFKEFKEFATKGNVLDLAVGVIIGAAFGKIVTSLVNDILMPPLGKLMGEVNFADRFIVIDPVRPLVNGVPIHSLSQAKAAGVTVIAYGQFINSVLEFLIVGVSVFLLVRSINVVRRRWHHEAAAVAAVAAAVAAEPTAQEKLLMEIRDLLKK